MGHQSAAGRRAPPPRQRQFALVQWSGSAMPTAGMAIRTHASSAGWPVAGAWRVRAGDRMRGGEGRGGRGAGQGGRLRRPARRASTLITRRLERLVAAERRVLRELGSIESTVLDEVLPRLSRAADHGVLWIGIAGGLALSGRSGRRVAGRGLVALSLASATTNVLLKRASGRRRPPSGLVPARREPRRVPFTTSFPSGHAASAAAFSRAVTWVIWPRPRWPRAPVCSASPAATDRWPWWRRSRPGTGCPSSVCRSVPATTSLSISGWTRTTLHMR